MIINTPFKFGDIVYKILPDNTMSVDEIGRWNIPYPEVQLVKVTEENFFNILNEWNIRYFLSKNDAKSAREEFELLCMSHGRIDRKSAFDEWMNVKIQENLTKNLIKL